MTGMTALLLFALWTLLMMFTSRAYRLSQFGTMKKPVNAYPRDIVNDDPPFFVRAEHAHLNCLENLPIFAAIVLAASAMGQSAMVDGLAYYVILARVAQSVTHLIGTSVMLVWIRATFFFVQVILFFIMFVKLL